MVLPYDNLLGQVMAILAEVFGPPWMICAGSFVVYILLRVATRIIVWYASDGEIMEHVATGEDDETTADLIEYDEEDDIEEDDDDYLTCAYCGTDNPYGARSCSSCGAPARKAFR